MFPTLQIGPLSLQMPGLVLILALWLGLTLAERFAPRRSVSADTLYKLVFAALIGGLVGARLAYVLQYPNAFAASPAGVISLNPSLLDPFGGLVGALLTGLVYGQRKKMPFWATLDALTPLFAVLAVGLGGAHFASGNAFGAPTSLPWAVELWGAQRHPSQVYETIAALAVLGWMWREFESQVTPGTVFFHFVALTAGYTLFLEAFRGDSSLILGSIRAGQVAAWLGLAISLFMLNKLNSSKTVRSLETSDSED